MKLQVGDYMDKNYMFDIEKWKKKIFKILPIYEGKEYKNQGKIELDIAYNNFNKYLNGLIIELKGTSKRNDLSNYIIMLLGDILNILYGIQNIGIDKQILVKQSVFKMMSILNKLEVC
jgi:hypothetical protein